MTIFTKGLNTKLKLTGVMTTLALLSACATTTGTTTAQSTPATATNMPAKDALASAVKSQLYHSFGYHTSVYVSNEAHRQATDAPQEQSGIKTCENTHDDAYVALLKKAHQEKGKTVDLTKNYPDESKAIKSAYQACMAKIEAEQGAYQPFDFDDFYQATHQLSDEEKANRFLADGTAHVVLQSTGVQDTDNAKDPALELKKAKLLDAYLLKPSHISISGRYHPLKGQFTALPSIQYDAKNLHLSVNQPMLVDIKAGGIYLWADNFALANSQFLDKSLGDKWHNKWLFLPFNDGSLPEGFAKDLGKAYLNAKKESFLALPSDSFVWTQADELAGVPYLSNNLPSTALSLMTNTPRIIKSEISTKDKTYQNYVFYDELYNAITKKYPELAMEQTFGNPHTAERDIVDGESVIEVRNAENKPEEPPTEFKMNAKMLMTIWLSGINLQSQTYYADNAEVAEEDAQKTPMVTYYGLQDNKLAWLSQRYHLDQQLKGGQFTKLGNEPMVIDVFTQIHQDPNKVKSFDSLPTPTEQNSVNLLTYKDEFLTNLKNSDDQYLQTILGLFLGQEAVMAEPADAESLELDGDEMAEPAIAEPAE